MSYISDNRIITGFKSLKNNLYVNIASTFFFLGASILPFGCVGGFGSQGIEKIVNIGISDNSTVKKATVKKAKWNLGPDGYFLVLPSGEVEELSRISGEHGETYYTIGPRNENSVCHKGPGDCSLFLPKGYFDNQ